MPAQAQQTFLYEINLYDQYKHKSMWTERERNIQKEHIAYLDSLTQNGHLELAGIVDQGLENHSGLIILRATDYNQALQIATKDPSVKNGMMSVRLRPFHIYFKKREE